MTFIEMQNPVIAVERIKRIIRQQLSRTEVSDNSTMDQLAIDSLELIDLVQHIESEFGIRIYDEQFPTLNTTITNLAKMVDTIRAADTC